jgi:hypothetical protein
MDGRKLGVVAVAAGRTDGVGGRHDARTGDVALLDALLEGDVVVVRRADVAHGGEAGFEHRLAFATPTTVQKLSVNSRPR